MKLREDKSNRSSQCKNLLKEETSKRTSLQEGRMHSLVRWHRWDWNLSMLMNSWRRKDSMLKIQSFSLTTFKIHAIVMSLSLTSKISQTLTRNATSMLNFLRRRFNSKLRSRPPTKHKITTSLSIMSRMEPTINQHILKRNSSTEIA